MSTLDSLFQRLGRCYRKRQYEKTEPNVYIYNKNASGIGSVYDEDIHKSSINLISKYDSKILKEQDKINLVDELYSKENLKDTKFLKNFEDGLKILEHTLDSEASKKEAQKMLRKIDSIKVVPKTVYDKKIDLINEYKTCKNYEQKNNLRKEINQLIININKNTKWKYANQITQIIEDINCIDLKYDQEMGLLIEKDEEYDIDSRTF